MDGLRAESIVHPWQVERMRQIYLECRPWLSVQDLPDRSEVEQQEWWNSIKGHSKAFLYSPSEEPWKFVAFSLLRKKSANIVSPMIGIAEEYRGKGYARKIIQHYISAAGGALAGSARSDHTQILRLNYELGWQEVGEKDGMILLYHPGCIENHRQEEIYREILRYHGY